MNLFCWSLEFLGFNKDRRLPSEMTFSVALFEDPFSKKVREAVLQTMFFKKIIDNTLAPEDYGGYMVQDAVYVFDAIKSFRTAAAKMQGSSAYPPDYSMFYRGRVESYESYSSYFISKWKLKSGESVNMGPAAATCAAFIMSLAEKDPRNLVIGFLSCDMLWPWIAAAINSQVPKEHVYRSWVDKNLKNSTSSAQKFVNKFFSLEQDKAKCQKIFNEGIINELNFFRSACGEKTVDYSFGETS